MRLAGFARHSLRSLRKETRKQRCISTLRSRHTRACETRARSIACCSRQAVWCWQAAGRLTCSLRQALTFAGAGGIYRLYTVHLNRNHSSTYSFSWWRWRGRARKESSGFAFTGHLRDHETSVYYRLSSSYKHWFLDLSSSLFLSFEHIYSNNAGSVVHAAFPVGCREAGANPGKRAANAAVYHS